MDMLNANAAAVFPGISPRHIYDLAAPDGPILCYRIGGGIVFSSDDLKTYLQSCRVETGAADPSATAIDAKVGHIISNGRLRA